MATAIFEQCEVVQTIVTYYYLRTSTAFRVLFLALLFLPEHFVVWEASVTSASIFRGVTNWLHRSQTLRSRRLRTY